MNKCYHEIDAIKYFKGTDVLNKLRERMEDKQLIVERIVFAGWFPAGKYNNMSGKYVIECRTDVCGSLKIIPYLCEWDANTFCFTFHTSTVSL